MQIGFLGPAGSFAQVALQQLDIAKTADLVPEQTVNSALEAVRTGKSGYALVPIENSVEGSISVTLDELSTGEQLYIIDEVVIPVEFVLAARSGTQLKDITAVATHPHAAAQVRNWLARNLPSAAIIPATSTSAAAVSLSDAACGFQAVVCQKLAAELYQLEVLFESIADNTDASTRFVLVSKREKFCPPTGADKTTLSVFMRQDHPGALLEILTEFSVRGVNLTRIESRPTKKQLGDYFFSVDFEGHLNDLRVSEALAGLYRICLEVRFLGSYPRHDGKSPILRPGVTDKDFSVATEWISNLKGKG